MCLERVTTASGLRTCRAVPVFREDVVPVLGRRMCSVAGYHCSNAGAGGGTFCMSSRELTSSVSRSMCIPVFTALGDCTGDLPDQTRYGRAFYNAIMLDGHRHTNRAIALIYVFVCRYLSCYLCHNLMSVQCSGPDSHDVS